MKLGFMSFISRVFPGKFWNKMTYMVVTQKWVMLSVGEEKCISTKAGENNWSASDESKICVSFSMRFFSNLFHSFSNPFLLLCFLLSFICYISSWLILPGSSVLFPLPFWLGLCWDRHKTHHRTWISSQNVMPLTCRIATVSLHWFCLRFWK